MARALEAIGGETALLPADSRAAAEAMGPKTCAKDPVDSVTAILMPDGVDEPELRKAMRDKYGFHVAGGQGELKEKIIRLSHMGYVDAFDTLGAISALEMALKSQGYDAKTGSGVAAAPAGFREGVA